MTGSITYEFPWDGYSTAVLTAAADLDPDDHSFRAEHLREVAQSVRDHRSCNPAPEGWSR